MGRQTFNVHVGHSTNDDEQDPSERFVQQQSEGSRIISLHGDVNEHSIASVIAQLLHLAGQNQRPISLMVSTYGGSIDEMFSLYDTIKFLPCPVHTIAMGKVMSAGVLLLAAGKKGKRLVGRNARLMMHPVSGGAIGNVFEVINESREMKRHHDLMITTLEKETKMKKADIERVMKAGHDYYITADEAIRLGIVDAIVGEGRSK